MDAKELHDLYGPLHEAVPETRPEGLKLSTYSIRDNGDPHWTHHGNWTDEAASAALCRVAAEDWLRSAGFDLFLTDTDCNTIVRVDPPSDRMLVVVRLRKFPSVHHAIVPACLAVAEAKSAPA